MLPPTSRLSDNAHDGTLRVANVVFKLKVKNISSRLRESKIAPELSFKSYTNFDVIRGLCHITLVAFTKSGHTNVTGVRNFEQASHVLNLISQVLQEPELVYEDIKFVSSTATGRLSDRVELAKIALGSQRSIGGSRIDRRTRKTPIICLQYGFFPSLIIRHWDKKGCVQLFCSGKFNIVGCSNVEDIVALWSCLNVLTSV